MRVVDLTNDSSSDNEDTDATVEDANAPECEFLFIIDLAASEDLLRWFKLHAGNVFHYPAFVQQGPVDATKGVYYLQFREERENSVSLMSSVSSKNPGSAHRCYILNS